MEGRGPQSPVLYCIYRARHAADIRPLVDEVLSLDGQVALWALEQSDPHLAEWTTGVGPGQKFALVRELGAAVAPAPEQPVVVADDDVVLPSGGLSQFLVLAERAELDLAQPAHARRSHWSHPITRRRWWSTARRTTFVEIGPMFVVRGPRGHAILPDLPDDMGWGLELDWLERSRRGELTMGIVDAVPVLHLAAAGTNYGLDELRAATEARLQAFGARDWRDVQRTLATWYRWQPQPRWSTP